MSTNHWKIGDRVQKTEISLWGLRKIYFGTILDILTRPNYRACSVRWDRVHFDRECDAEFEVRNVNRLLRVSI